jgi:hypothetical protein
MNRAFSLFLGLCGTADMLLLLGVLSTSYSFGFVIIQIPGDAV